ncbi:hypothetical protein DFJ73DRAFT_815521 [Zopfochytrium polystomum]|nr:hypothetical protein DFJ73DRAFT_815521 [Zopfochytrium polystomum]
MAPPLRRLPSWLDIAAVAPAREEETEKARAATAATTTTRSAGNSARSRSTKVCVGPRRAGLYPSGDLPGQGASWGGSGPHHCCRRGTDKTSNCLDHSHPSPSAIRTGRSIQPEAATFVEPIHAATMYDLGQEDRVRIATLIAKYAETEELWSRTLEEKAKIAAERDELARQLHGSQQDLLLEIKERERLQGRLCEVLELQKDSLVDEEDDGAHDLNQIEDLNSDRGSDSFTSGLEFNAVRPEEEINRLLEVAKVNALPALTQMPNPRLPPRTISLVRAPRKYPPKERKPQTHVKVNNASVQTDRMIRPQKRSAATRGSPKGPIRELDPPSESELDSIIPLLGGNCCVSSLLWPHTNKAAASIAVMSRVLRSQARRLLRAKGTAATARCCGRTIRVSCLSTTIPW